MQVQHCILILQQHWENTVPMQVRAGGSPCSLSRSIRWGMPKLRGGGHFFKRERKNPSVPRIPLRKAGTGSSDTARAVFHGLQALGAGTVEIRVTLRAGCGRRLRVSACSGLMCNF